MKNLVTGLMLAGMLLIGGVPVQAQEPTDSTTTTTVDSQPAVTPDVNVDVQSTTTQPAPAAPTFDVDVTQPATTAPVTNTSTTERTTERTEILTPVSTTEPTDSSTVLMLVGGGLAILIILALVAMAVNRNDGSGRTVITDRREVVR